MDDAMTQAAAKQTYAMVCKMLDNNDWKYQADPEKMRITCGARGDDLPIEVVIDVDAKRQIVFLLSQIPVVVAEDKRLDIAVAISTINNDMVHGCFDYNLSSGRIYFRMVNSFAGSELGQDALYYLLMCTCQTVDQYNDKLLMLGKGLMTLEQFLQAEAN